MTELIKFFGMICLANLAIILSAVSYIIFSIFRDSKNYKDLKK